MVPLIMALRQNFPTRLLVNSRAGVVIPGNPIPPGKNKEKN